MNSVIGKLWRKFYNAMKIVTCSPLDPTLGRAAWLVIYRNATEWTLSPSPVPRPPRRQPLMHYKQNPNNEQYGRHVAGCPR